MFFFISLYNYLFYLNTWFWVNWRDFKPSTTLKTQREHFLESSKRNGQKSKFGEICNYDILHHSSEIKSLCLMKLSSETLWNTKTHDCSFMFFTSLYLILQKNGLGQSQFIKDKSLIFDEWHNTKSKVPLLQGFGFFFHYIINFFSI